MKWEYKSKRVWLAEHELNALGKEGWELIQVLQLMSGDVYFLFKRPVNQEKPK
jgi:hypothetical protein